MERRLVLNNLANTRRTISRLARDYYSGDFQNNLDAHVNDGFEVDNIDGSFWTLSAVL